MVRRFVRSTEVATHVVTQAARFAADTGAMRLARSDGAARLADAAVAALIEEARLTPKPGLVDTRGAGAHTDLDFAVMFESANSLRPSFIAMGAIARCRPPTQRLREELAAIGRAAEEDMMRATRGSNAHRGAIWALGLLVAGTVMSGADRSARAIAGRAAAVARYPDRYAPTMTPPSNGARVGHRFGVAGARGEAKAGFPHAIEIGMPALAAARLRGDAEEDARLAALLSIMSSLDDTCLLHRGGQPALDAAKSGARAVLDRGGASTPAGRKALLEVDADLRSRRASPGGSADMLAAVLFLDRVSTSRSRNAMRRQVWS